MNVQRKVVQKLDLDTYLKIIEIGEVVLFVNNYSSIHYQDTIRSVSMKPEFAYGPS